VIDVQVGDVYCWPTNLGWVIGPTLIYHCFLNGATLALYHGSPQGRGFGKFVQVSLPSTSNVFVTLCIYIAFSDYDLNRFYNMSIISFPSQQIHHTKAQLYSLYYDRSGCRCYHFGNRSKLSEILEEYSMYGGLGLDKDKVIYVASVKTKIAIRKMN
jgi:hypothetical protein